MLKLNYYIIILYEKTYIKVINSYTIFYTIFYSDHYTGTFTPKNKKQYMYRLLNR